MPTYLSLLNWTKEGLEKIKDSPVRLDAARKAIESGGGKLKSFYLLMGQYDMAIIVEAPDDATLAVAAASGDAAALRHHRAAGRELTADQVTAPRTENRSSRQDSVARTSPMISAASHTSQ